MNSVLPMGEMQYYLSSTWGWEQDKSCDISLQGWVHFGDWNSWAGLWGPTGAAGGAGVKIGIWVVCMGGAEFST